MHGAAVGDVWSSCRDSHSHFITTPWKIGRIGVTSLAGSAASPSRVGQRASIGMATRGSAPPGLIEQLGHSLQLPLIPRQLLPAAGGLRPRAPRQTCETRI